MMTTNDQKQGGKLLIDDWRQAHKMWSVLAAAMLAGFDTLHGVLPAVQSVVGPTAFTWINVGSAVAIVCCACSTSRVRLMLQMQAQFRLLHRKPRRNPQHESAAVGMHRR